MSERRDGGDADIDVSLYGRMLLGTLLYNTPIRCVYPRHLTAHSPPYALLKDLLNDSVQPERAALLQSTHTRPVIYPARRGINWGTLNRLHKRVTTLTKKVPMITVMGKYSRIGSQLRFVTHLSTLGAAPPIWKCGQVWTTVFHVFASFSATTEPILMP